MFNLIIKYSAWNESMDEFPLQRTFEHTEQHLVDRFKPSGKLDMANLSKLPTLFVQETQSDGSQIARVGNIIKAQNSGANISLRYSYDPSVPPISNKRLETLAPMLGFNRYLLTRTHWAIKDEDLFHVLLTNSQPARAKPSVFTLPDCETVDDKLVAVMMPFRPEFDAVFDALRVVCDGLGLVCQRADDLWSDPRVMQDVISLIDRAHVTIADCSTRNANVFYEIGIAHTLGREVLLIAQSDTDVPFDLHHLRYKKYANTPDGLEALATHLRGRLSK